LPVPEPEEVKVKKEGPMSGKLIAIITVLVLLLIFVIQNTQAVAVKFLFWGGTTSIAVTILISFGVGFLCGWIVTVLRPQAKTEPPSSSLSKENRKV
jgi:uncharacterized integral membrane protein